MMLSTTKGRQIANVNDFLVWRYVGQSNMDALGSYQVVLDGNNYTDSGLSVVLTTDEISHIRGILTGYLLRYEDADDIELDFYAYLNLANAATPNPGSALTRELFRTQGTVGTNYSAAISISYTWENLAADIEYTLTALGKEATSAHTGYMRRWNLQMDVCRV